MAIASPHQGSPPAVAATRSWLLVKVGGDTFGIAVPHVREILSVIGISRLKDAPFPVRGALQVRNARIPVVDLRLRMGLGEGELLDSRVVVVESRGRRVGLLVDSVDRLSELGRIEPLPADVSTSGTSYLYGVCQGESETILLLDLEQTLTVATASGRPPRPANEPTPPSPSARGDG